MATRKLKRLRQVNVRIRSGLNEERATLAARNFKPGHCPN